jgi:hypothetical protein
VLIPHLVEELGGFSRWPRFEETATPLGAGRTSLGSPPGGID